MRVGIIAVFASLCAFINNVQCSNYDLYKDKNQSNEQNITNEKDKHTQCPKHKYYKHNSVKQTQNRRNEGRVFATHD